MFKRLSKAYSIAELSVTAYGKESYKRKIPAVYMVYDKAAGTYHTMTYKESQHDDNYRIVAIRLLENKEICYGVML